MNANFRDRVAGTLLLAFAVAWCVAVQLTVRPGQPNETVGPRAVPFWLGIALAALALILILGSYLKASALDDKVLDAVSPEARTAARWGRAWAISLVSIGIVVYALVMEWFGFVPATIAIIAGILFFGLRERSPAVLVGMS
ncbi:MAG: tripartite tricarboxylate transporter TctB family protein, partial [Stellaceae bacterium]